MAENAFAEALGRDPACECPACRLYRAYAPGAEDYLGRLAREIGVGDRAAHVRAAEVLSAAFLSLAGALLIRAYTMTDAVVQYPSSLDSYQAQAAFEAGVRRVRGRFEALTAVMARAEGRE